MKSFGGLWPRMTSWEHLHEAYLRARRGKSSRPDVAEFEAHREAHLLRLRDELRRGRWRPGGYRHFWIRLPKRRCISAAPFRDRVVHHAIVGVLEPLFEPRFIHDSYACRVGKGTHRCVARARHYLRRFRYVLQADIRKFFPSVDHEVLLGVVSRRIRDRRVLGLLSEVLATHGQFPGAEGASPWFEGDDLFAALRPRGLPIGNLTSQFLANVLLDVLDHEVVEGIRPGGYVRYCDDFLLFDDDRERLHEARRRIERALDRLRLHLHPQKTFVNPTAVGITFLGYRLRGDDVRLTSSSISRANARMRRLSRSVRSGALDPSDAARSSVAWWGHARHANAAAVVRALHAKHGLPVPRAVPRIGDSRSAVSTRAGGAPR